MKFISFFFMLTAQIMVQTIYFIVAIPVSFVKSQIMGFRSFLIQQPEEIRKLLKVYDTNGLLHNARYLSLETTRNYVASLPVSKQIDFADFVTSKSVRKKRPYKDVSFDYDSLIYSLKELDMTMVNATSIGNLAFLATYCDNEDLKLTAADTLEYIRGYFGNRNPKE